ncbi:hypothetical protein QTP88_012708 [Uroleucon formosanum]
MKFVLAFLLLIGISCQIGRGDCTPADTLYGDIKQMIIDGTDYIKKTIDEYTPDFDLDTPSVTDSIKEGYEKTKDGLSDMAEGAGQITKNTMDDIAKVFD